MRTQRAGGRDRHAVVRVIQPRQRRRHRAGASDQFERAQNDRRRIGVARACRRGSASPATSAVAAWRSVGERREQAIDGAFAGDGEAGDGGFAADGIAADQVRDQRGGLRGR